MNRGIFPVDTLESRIFYAEMPDIAAVIGAFWEPMLRGCSIFDRRLKTLSGLTPYEYICKI